MKPTIHTALLALLVAAPAWSQDVNVYSTTIAQMWKQDTPGFDKSTLAPATLFLGIDATKLGDEAISFHLFGWGMADLADASTPRGKGGGDFSVGYLQYRFAQANAEIKAGRFAIYQGVGVEHVDGVSARTDLKGGFAISAFGGRPVRFRTQDPLAQRDYEYQRDFIFGTRLSWRPSRLGEVGLSYLQDGTKGAEQLTQPSLGDFTRKQMGLDLKVTPLASLDFSGRTVFDLAKRSENPIGEENTSRIAEHDYTLAVKVVDTVSFSGSFTERNFRAYFAGTNMPSLFRTDEKGKFSAFGGNLYWNPTFAPIRIVADFRHTSREIYGDADRFGAEVRWNPADTKIQTGFGYHRVSAEDVLKPGTLLPSYGLSHGELRAWVMYERERMSASLDGILLTFDDKANPNLNGKSSAYEAVASLGYRASDDLKVSADLGIGANPLYKNEARGLLRVEYRFGFVRNGGRK